MRIYFGFKGLFIFVF